MKTFVVMSSVYWSYLGVTEDGSLRTYENVEDALKFEDYATAEKFACEASKVLDMTFEIDAINRY